MAKTAYLSRKLLNQLKVKETESTNLMLTHNLHNITINGKRVGCSGHIQNVLNNKCVYVSTEKSCYQPLSDKNLVRYAASMKDYSSVSLGAKGRNQFVTNDESHMSAQRKPVITSKILKAFNELLVSKNLGNSVPSGDNRYQLHSKILSCLRSREEGLE